VAAVPKVSLDKLKKKTFNRNYLVSKRTTSATTSQIVIFPSVVKYLYTAEGTDYTETPEVRGPSVEKY
jgi:hypothetical protein